MEVEARVYAQLAELVAGGRRQRLEVPPGTTVLELADRLGCGDVALEIMVNGERAHNGVKLAPGDVVAYFPALAGG